MNKKILLWSITAAFAGFLFGFDTVVISGAEKKLQLLWGTTDLFHGSVIIGMALWGTVIGAVFGSIPTNKLGRKQTLIWIGVLFTISAIGSGLANGPWTFAVFRFIGGIGVGVSTIAAPAYISEIAPAKDRGKLVGLYQFNIVFGILTAFFSNYLLNDIGENAWRWMVGIEALPSIIYTLLVLMVPKSPRWLITKSRSDEAKEVIDLLSEDQDQDSEKLILEIKDEMDNTVPNENIFLKKYRFPLAAILNLQIVDAVPTRVLRPSLLKSVYQHLYNE